MRLIMRYSVNIKGQFIRGGVKWTCKWVHIFISATFTIKHKSVAGVGDAKLNKNT